METLKLMEAIVSTVTVLAFIASIFFSPIFFAVTAIPGLAYLIYVWRKDRIEREPLFMVFAVFSYGFIVSALVSLIAETSLGELAEPVMTIPVVEELAKFIGVYLVSMRRTVFNELDDGIVYGAASGLGFATLEAIIYAFQGLIYSAGLILIFAGSRVYKTSLPRWYGDSMAASGIAVLMGASIIAYYLFNIISTVYLGGLLAGTIVLNYLLARRFNSKGLMLEAIISAIMIGFIISWFIPAYPIGQLYLMTLFVVLFVRLPENVKENSKIMLSFYVKFVSLALFQRYVLWIKNMTPDPLIYYLSVLSCTLLYISFEMQSINRTHNALFSATSIGIISYIVGVPLEPTFCAVLANYIAGVIIHAFKKPAIKLENLAVDEVIGIIYAIALSVYSANSGYFPDTGPHVFFVKAYIGFLIICASIAKAGIDLKLVKDEAEREKISKSQIGPLIIVLSYLVLIGLVSFPVDQMSLFIIPLMPISIVIIADLLDFERDFNYFISFLRFDF